MHEKITELKIAAADKETLLSIYRTSQFLVNP
jgi:hypothetical protein